MATKLIFKKIRRFTPRGIEKNFYPTEKIYSGYFVFEIDASF